MKGWKKIRKDTWWRSKYRNAVVNKLNCKWSEPCVRVFFSYEMISIKSTEALRGSWVDFSGDKSDLRCTLSCDYDLRTGGKKVSAGLSFWLTFFFSPRKTNKQNNSGKCFPPPRVKNVSCWGSQKKQSLNNITAHVHECCRLCFVTSSWPAVILSWLFKASALSYGWRKEIYPSHIGCDQKVNTEQTIFPQPSSETLTRRSEGLGSNGPLRVK